MKNEDLTPTCLKGLTALSTLYLGGTHVSDTGRASLGKALPKLKTG
ncbi:MAG: hypothetical protein AB1778_03630 [Candidatus Bipolaricaulota bacterium]